MLVGLKGRLCMVPWICFKRVQGFFFFWWQRLLRQVIC